MPTDKMLHYANIIILKHVLNFLGAQLKVSLKDIGPSIIHIRQYQVPLGFF